MSYQIVVSEKEKCVIVIHKEKMEMGKYLKMAGEAGPLLREKKWNRIIIDARNQSSSFSIIEEYALTTKSADLFPKKCRIALLTLEIKKEQISFIKKIFLNHDIFFDVFCDFSNAIEWLSRNKSQCDYDEKDS
jgi:hypothetical protein